MSGGKGEIQKPRPLRADEAASSYVRICGHKTVDVPEATSHGGKIEFHQPFAILAENKGRFQKGRPCGRERVKSFTSPIRFVQRRTLGSRALYREEVVSEASGTAAYTSGKGGVQETRPI